MDESLEMRQSISQKFNYLLSFRTCRDLSARMLCRSTGSYECHVPSDGLSTLGKQVV